MHFVKSNVRSTTQKQWCNKTLKYWKQNCTNYDAKTVTFTWVTVHDTTKMTYTNQIRRYPVVPMSSHKYIMTYVTWIQTKFLLLLTNSPTHPWISWVMNEFYQTLCPPNQYNEMQLDVTVKQKGKISCYLIFSSWKWHQRTWIVVAIATWPIIIGCVCYWSILTHYPSSQCIC